MADAFHSQSTKDGTEASPPSCSQPHTDASAAPTGANFPAAISSSSSEALSAGRFLQPPTFSFTPATPSPPPGSHDAIDDSMFKGFLSSNNEVNSLSSPPLTKGFAGEANPAAFAEHAQDIPGAKSPDNGIEKSHAVTEGSLEKSPLVPVAAAEANDREIANVAGYVEQSEEVPVSAAASAGTQGHHGATSKVETSSVMSPRGCFENQVTGSVSSSEESSKIAGDGVAQGMEIPDIVLPLKENSPTIAKQGVDERTECSNGNVVSTELVRSSLPSENSSERYDLGERLQEGKSLTALNSDKEQISVNDLASGQGSGSGSPFARADDASKLDSNCEVGKHLPNQGIGTNVISDHMQCDAEGVNNENNSTPRDGTSKRDSEPMEVDQEKLVENATELSKSPGGSGGLCDDIQGDSLKDNSHSELASSDVEENSTSGFAEVAGASRKGTLELLKDIAEPLQPVTIGGSLQPLEEVQEASIMNDPSFTADLSMIDSSADEADSIGGLVINNVIGAAEGMADFPPDDEVEADKQLTDISLSAPRMMQENGDGESSEDNGPCAKRRKLDLEKDEKLEGSSKVVIRIVPLKNGHGLWDSVKLKEVLLSKGTIHLRIHASMDEAENFDLEKCEVEVDFSCVMFSASDGEEEDSVLENFGPDADTCDSMSVENAKNGEHTPPLQYMRAFPSQTRGRSTALQPAIPRIPYRQLQSQSQVSRETESHLLFRELCSCFASIHFIRLLSNSFISWGIFELFIIFFCCLF